MAKQHASNRIGKRGGTKPAFTAQGNPNQAVPVETRSLGDGYYCVIDVARNDKLEDDIDELKKYVKGLVNASKDRKPDAKARGKSDSV